MATSPNQFVWYELMTTDPEAAEAFYKSVVGWDYDDPNIPGRPYKVLLADKAPIGGMMALPEEARATGLQPIWVGYIGVDEVDAAAKRLTEAGGTVHRAPEDIPGIGRFAVVADPQGATLLLFRQAFEGEPPRPAPGTPGSVAWRELFAGDGEKAFDFYAQQFGWTKDQAMPMGELGVYQLFAAGAEPVGAMHTKPPEVPAPFWLFYFAVENIDAARERVAAGGGEVLFDPREVPNDMWVVHCRDPQGAIFALVGPRT